MYYIANSLNINNYNMEYNNSNTLTISEEMKLLLNDNPEDIEKLIDETNLYFNNIVESLESQQGYEKIDKHLESEWEIEWEKNFRAENQIPHDISINSHTLSALKEHIENISFSCTFQTYLNSLKWQLSDELTELKYTIAFLDYINSKIKSTIFQKNNNESIIAKNILDEIFA